MFAMTCVRSRCALIVPTRAEAFQRSGTLSLLMMGEVLMVRELSPYLLGAKLKPQLR